MAHKIIVNLNVFSPVPLYQQFADELRGIINSGTVKPGEKLPSIRELSRQLQISTITVREAIDRLIEEGIIQARQGSGNFVASHLQAISVAVPGGRDGAPLQFSQFIKDRAYEELDATIKWSAEGKSLNRAFNSSRFHPWWDLPASFDFRVYQAPLDPVAGLHWERALSSWSRHYVPCSEAGRDPRGLVELREHLASWLNRTRQLDCQADDLMIVSGAQQARDLVARLLVEKGRQVVFEEPCSITDSLAYSTKGAELVLVPQEDDGLDVNCLDSHRLVTAAHIISSASFPAGKTMSMQKRESLLDWARQNQVVIVEDSYGGGFVHETPVEPTLYQMARAQGESPAVIYLGSLSQLINPALRLGFVVLPASLQNSFSLTKWLAERHSSLLSQQLALKLFSDGHFEEDCLRVTQATRSRRKAMLAALRRWPQELISWTPVKAGLQQPLWFKQEIDDLLVFERALALGIGVIPMSPYYRRAQVRHGLSLSFFQMSESKITEGLDRLLEVVLSTGS